MGSGEGERERERRWEKVEGRRQGGKDRGRKVGNGEGGKQEIEWKEARSMWREYLIKSR